MGEAIWVDVEAMRAATQVINSHGLYAEICDCALGQHIETTGCECDGWDASDRSVSHAAHVAQALADAGLLSDAGGRVEP